MLCRLAEHSVYCSHTAKAYSTLDSVVYNDSTFGQEKQENDKSARIPTLFNFFSSAKETVEPPGSQSCNANTS